MISAKISADGFLCLCLCLCLSLVGGVSYASANVSLNHDDLKDLIKNKNRKFMASNLDLSSSENRLNYVSRSFLPTALVSLTDEKFQTAYYPKMTQPEYILRLNFNLFKGGRDALEESARVAQRNGTQAGMEQVFQNELFALRKLFWELVYSRELRNIYLNAIQQNKINLERASKRISAGLTTQVDRLEFEISSTQLQQDLARIEVNISNTQRHIAALTNFDPETQFDTILEIPHDHFDALGEEKFDAENFRDVRLEKSSQADLQARGKIFKRWWTPSLNLYGESILYNFRERNFYRERDRVDNAVGINLALNFDGLQEQRDGEALVARSEAAGLRASQIKAETEATFNTSKQLLLLLHKLIHEGEKNVEKGRHYMEMTLSDYNRGIKNSPDVLSAMLKNLEFKKRFVELRRDYAVTKAQMQSILSI
jgi:outer membrane protein